MEHNHHKGFTLLEVMVAISIFAVIGLGCWQVLDNAITSDKRLNERAQHLQQLQRAMWVISRDINNIIDRAVRNANGYKEAPLTSLQAGFGLQLTHGGWPNPAQTKRSELQRSAYSLEPNNDGGYDLIRTYWPSLDRAPETPAIQQHLLHHITYLEFEFIDQAGKTWFYWPLGNEKDADNQKIPAGIVIKIGTEDFGDIERVYALRDRAAR